MVKFSKIWSRWSSLTVMLHYVQHQVLYKISAQYVPRQMWRAFEQVQPIN